MVAARGVLAVLDEHRRRCVGYHRINIRPLRNARRRRPELADRPERLRLGPRHNESDPRSGINAPTSVDQAPGGKQGVDTSMGLGFCFVSTPNCRRLARAEQFLLTIPSAAQSRAGLAECSSVKIIQERSST